MILDVYRLTRIGQNVQPDHPLRGELLVRYVRHKHPRMIVLCSPSGARHLARCQMVHGGGTFHIAPPGYMQLYPIIGCDPSGENVIDA
jgi:hypothetical protein